MTLRSTVYLFGASDESQKAPALSYWWL